MKGCVGDGGVPGMEGMTGDMVSTRQFIERLHKRTVILYTMVRKVLWNVEIGLTTTVCCALQLKMGVPS